MSTEKRQTTLTSAGEEPDDTILLTLDEVARQLRCSRRTVDTLVSQKTPPERRLKSIHIGRSHRVSRDDLMEYVRALKGESA